MTKLSIVVCARNEANHVYRVLTELRDVYPDAELILVDNASDDGTAETARLIVGVRVVSEARRGKGAAMRKGAEAASNPWILFHDADLEYNVNDSVEVVASAINNDSFCIGARLVAYDTVLASSWIANKIIQTLLKWRTGIHVPDVLSGTRCLQRAIFVELNTKSVQFGIETEMTRQLLSKGVRFTQASVRFCPRNTMQGKKIRAWHLFELMWRAIG